MEVRTARETVRAGDLEVDRAPVTNGRYEEFVLAAGHRPPIYWEGGSCPVTLREHPVVGVDWFDAQAYIAWKRARDKRAYLLPKLWMWEVASGHSPTGRSYPFGNVFRPKWVCSNWSRPKAKIEPVLSYPVDESPFGVFDMSGSVMEWLDAWWGSGEAERWLAGGAWGYSDPVLFKSPGGWGSRPDRTTGTYGFRLAILDGDRK